MKRNKLKCIDNLDFMRSINNQSIQLVVTSPPYNLGKSYEKKISIEQYIKEQEAVIKECYRILNNKGSICWQVGNHINGEVVPLDIMLYETFKKQGLKLRNRIIWHFGHGLHCQKRFSGRYETIMWWTKEDDYVFNLDPVRVPSKYPNKRHYKGSKKGQLSGNPLGKNPSDIWDIPNVKNNHPEKTAHPCQFPVELVERLVLSMTNKGDIVFDPYMGVGSSAIAAIKNNRVAYGCDISETYFDLAIERINCLKKGTLKLRKMHTPIYDPKK